MPSVADCLCCQEVDELGWKLQDLTCIFTQATVTS